MATPRFVPSEASETMPGVRGREYCQISLAGARVEREDLVRPVTYMMPSATSGTVSNP